MILCIRTDDLGWTDEVSPTPPIKLPDRGLKIAQKFHEAMGGVPYLAGVIPSCVDDEGLAWLRSKPEGMTVALHGWDHGATRPHERDEFSGMSEKKIRDRIAKAQDRVGPTRHLIPPYNAVCQRLPDAAWHEGIRYLWGGEHNWSVPPMPWQIGRLWNIPAWAALYGASTFKQGPNDPIVIDSVRSISKCLDAINHDVPCVLTLHIGWESARHADFRGVRELAAEIATKAIHPDTFVQRFCL